jgi:polyisoprenoid-binding protein YceI
MGRAGVVALSMVLAAGAAGVRTFEADPSARRVRIRLGRTGLLKFLGHEHEIDAAVAEGRVELAQGDPSRSSVRLRFEAGRLAVVPGTEPAEDVPTVEARMRGPEVLDVDRYPVIVFSSASVTGSALAPGRYRLLVQGVLEIKGRSVPVAIPLEARLAGDVLEGRGDVELRLRDLGIEPPSVAGVVKVADRFQLSFAIVARPPG